MYKLIKAILFDLDGTLLNRDKSVEKFVKLQYDRLHKWVGHIPKERYVSRFIELDCRGYVWKDKVYKQLVEEFKISETTWDELFLDYIDNFKYCCVPFSGLVNMLDELRSSHLILGMITNGHGQFQMDNIKALGIEDFFETILISEWEGIKKPNPQIFSKALDQLNLLPHQCAFVGDHPENDVRAAKNVGMKNIWKRDPQWDNFDADFIIDDLSELPAIIKKINKNKIDSS